MTSPASQPSPDADCCGLLLIGDPHLEGRIPGFRNDDYPQVVLGKIAWCLDYARTHRLLPALLGDLFHLPRDNPNWLLVELVQLFRSPLLAIYGNHDVHANRLSSDDSFSILAHAGCMHLLDEENLFHARMGGRRVIVGGTSWGRRLPREFVLPDDGADDMADDGAEQGGRPLVFWLSHHDVIVPGYEEAGRIRPREIPGIDAVINGHIHRRLDTVVAGSTHWLTPGNISRRARSDASREHVPAVLRIDIDQHRWQPRHVTVPHAPFDDVFHSAIVNEMPPEDRSAFVAGLAELQARRTATGAGLRVFLENNLDQFEHEVAEQVRSLAEEIMNHG